LPSTCAAPERVASRSPSCGPQTVVRALGVNCCACLSLSGAGFAMRVACCSLGDVRRRARPGASVFSGRKGAAPARPPGASRLSARRPKSGGPRRAAEGNGVPRTHTAYVDRGAAFAKHCGKSPQLLGPKEVRASGGSLRQVKHRPPDGDPCCAYLLKSPEVAPGGAVVSSRALVGHLILVSSCMTCSCV
jgi:hypothetical protein